MEWTPEQREQQQRWRSFVQEEVAPHAEQNDREEQTPQALLAKVAREGYLGALVPREYHGLGLDMLTFGLLNEELGKGCSSLRSLLTVQSMVEHALLRWGNRWQQERWLPELAIGELIGAFGLSEPEAGSDAGSLTTQASPSGRDYILNGQKCWLTYGQRADIFLIFARLKGRVTAFLVERERSGLTVEPIRGMLGLRASMLAQVFLRDCLVPAENMLGGVSSVWPLWPAHLLIWAGIALPGDVLVSRRPVWMLQYNTLVSVSNLVAISKIISLSSR